MPQPTTLLPTVATAVLVLVASAGLSAAQAADPSPLLAVQSYTGIDGPQGYYGYDDQSYNGSRAGGWLSGGKGDLTDGVKNTSVAGGYWAWSPYVMWDGASPVLTFDLGSSQLVDSVVAYFNYYPQAAVYIPLAASLRFSGDGVNFGAAQLRNFSDVEQLPGGNDAVPFYELLLGGPGTGRYVELTLTTAGRWTALSEVELRGVTASVPEPQTWALWLAGLGAWGGLVRRRRYRADTAA
jgi:hypothetical protein